MMMPEVSGHEVITFLGTTADAVPAIQALPAKPKVIVLSAISRYFADRFPQDTVVLQKPFDIDRIEDVLRTLAAN